MAGFIQLVIALVMGLALICTKVVSKSCEECPVQKCQKMEGSSGKVYGENEKIALSTAECPDGQNCCSFNDTFYYATGELAPCACPNSRFKEVKEKTELVRKQLQLQNRCKEKQIELKFREYFKTTDRFYPESVITIECADQKRKDGYRVSDDRQCICKTQKRKIHFERRRGFDCRRWNFETMIIADGCKCFKNV